jgi:hypothetical protein
MTTAVLSTAYFPPISWLTVALMADNVTIDIHEHYIKQTWRNRCKIITANGLMDLIIPIRHTGNNTPVKDIEIDYSTNWQRVHLHAIKSAYGNSPYFDYYYEYVDAMFRQQPKYLINWNEIGIELIRYSLKLKLPYAYSEEYIETQHGAPDFRKLLVPGNQDEIPKTPHYHQVFQERHGFQKDLSVLDILFCEGPDAIPLINGSARI